MVSAQTGFKFAVREEVVVRLEGARAFDLERQVDVAETCLPAWTIATVTTQFALDGDAAYLIEFRRHGATCIAVVREPDIEGVA
jgi:hypothetical protein